MQEIIKYIDEIKNQYSQPIELNDGLLFNQKETLKTIDFYSNSKYLHGAKDDLGREKPFYNIVNFRKNVAVWATEFDVRDIKIESDNPNYRVQAFLLQHEVYEWMKESHFGKTLNDFANTRCKYGGVVLKKSEQDGKMKIDVCTWNNLDVDPVDIENGIIVETFYMLPHEVQELGYDTEKLLEKELGKKSFTGRIQVQEIHGYLPESFLEGKKDKTKYVRQKHFIIGNGKDRVSFGEVEKENPYAYCPYEAIDKRSLGRGIVEDGAESQAWVNDAIIKEHRILELAGRVIAKSSSKKSKRNVLTEVDNGYVFDVSDGGDISLLNLTPSSLPKFGELVNRWDTQLERVTSTFSAMTGEQQLSGTPYKQTALLNQQSESLFAYRKEEAGIFLERIFYKWVLPYLIKKLRKEHVLSSEYTGVELKNIDESFKNFYANNKAIDKALDTLEIPTQEQYAGYQNEMTSELESFGNKRHLTIPEKFFDGAEYKITFNISNESKNKMQMLEAFDRILTLGANPAIRQDPGLNEVFKQSLELMGYNTTSLADIKPQAQPIQPQQPQAVANQNTPVELNAR